jgi:hypothetical protein
LHWDGHARIDLPLLAQAEVGVAQLRFQPCMISTAQSALVASRDGLDKGIQTEEETWQLL